MKLLLKHGRTLAASIIRTRLCSNWSHSATLIGNQVYHSTMLGGGVHSVPATPEILSEFWASEEFGDDAQALARFKEREGRGYDFVGLFAYIPFIAARDGSRDFCFENTMYVAFGKRPPMRISPETLLMEYVNVKTNQLSPGFVV